MRQVQISKRHPPPAWTEPLPPDARDPDIVHAKQLARRASPAQRRPQHMAVCPPYQRCSIPGRWWHGPGASPEDDTPQRHDQPHAPVAAEW
jgi:hypothetical protein